MRTMLIFFLTIAAAGLVAQDYHSSFAHLGVNGTKALGHDAAGNLYAAAGGTGPYGNNQTFFPGPDNTMACDLPEWGFVVTKHAPDNTLLWWRGFSMDPTASAPGNLELLVYDMAVTDAGDIYVVGTFAGTVDFNPNTGSSYRTAVDVTGNDTYNAYLLKLDSSGGFQWVKTWRGTTEALAVAIAPNGNIHISGVFSSWQMDLDPGSNQEIVSNLVGNITLYAPWIATLTPSGTFMWGHAMSVDTTVTRQQLSVEMAGLTGIAVDDAGNLYLGGFFGGSFGLPGYDPNDYDPNELIFLTEGTPMPRLKGVGGNNLMVLSYDPAGNRRWANAYGTDLANCLDGNIGWDVAVDDEGSVYFTGTYKGIVSFDPPNGAVLTSTQDSTSGIYSGGVYLLKLDTDGAYQWVHGFNTSTTTNVGKRVIADDQGVVFGGIYGGSIDLNPGTGSAVHTASAGNLFLARYSRTGAYEWSVNFGSTGTVGSHNYPNSEIRAISMVGAYRIAVGGHFHGGFREPGASTQTILTAFNGQPTAWVMQLDQLSLHSALEIVTGSVADGTTGQATSAPFTAAGGSMIGLNWSLVQGELPPGITLASTTGASIQASGVPTETGMWEFDLRVEDDLGNFDVRTLTWTVVMPPLGGSGGAGQSAAGVGGGGGCRTGAGHGAWWMLALLALAGGTLLRRKIATT